jgi:hypothetical protein
MTPRETRRTLHGLRDTLLDAALRKVREEDWTVFPHLAHVADRRELAWLDEDEHLIHLHPHTAEDGPVEKTLLHELVHILLDKLIHRARDERTVTRLEDLLWPTLTSAHRRSLADLMRPR